VNALNGAGYASSIAQYNMSHTMAGVVFAAKTAGGVLVRTGNPYAEVVGGILLGSAEAYTLYDRLVSSALAGKGTASHAESSEAGSGGAAASAGQGAASGASAGGGAGAPEPEDDGPEKEDGRYEDAPYHGKTDNAVKSRRPTSGQNAFDNSIQVKDTSPRRIGVDKNNNEIVAFDKTQGNTYHGHVRFWSDLTPTQQSVLRAYLESG
jgi:hypothetical protein